ncbi:hypothetical protein HHL22_02505 [Hymenobacter sp. RP-2-7]|uniref:Uncharacterized protein n=1 Tax=Hymenobacter polaris TaxID=2682546 RepID=A0A7Y0FL72_9BACT|nr:hypothetical protein [Hymenobacter polaris]NML64066.1 hypothetical protein [Hymenobacter polaris]
MTWEKLRNEIYYIDGSWRDIYVLDVNQKDWQQWTDYVNENYVIDWFAVGCDNDITQERIDFEFIASKWNLGYYPTTARIYLAEIQINCHFFTDELIENDIDPSQIKSIDDHDRLVSYMKSISYLLNKEVILTAENIREAILIRINCDRVDFMEYS